MFHVKSGRTRSFSGLIRCLPERDGYGAVAVVVGVSISVADAKGVICTSSEWRMVPSHSYGGPSTARRSEGTIRFCDPSENRRQPRIDVIGDDISATVEAWRAELDFGSNTFRRGVRVPPAHPL